MKIQTRLIQEKEGFRVNAPQAGKLMITTEEFRPDSEYSRIPKGIFILNVYGNIIAFASNGTRFWTAETVRADNAVVLTLRVRNMEPGESITLTQE